MRNQLDLIQSGEWDTLIVLDACRADALRTIAKKYPWHGKAEIEVVRSPAACTQIWIERLGGHFEKNLGYYFSANPVVERTAAKRKFTFRRWSIWEENWARFSDQQIPSVHPMSVNGAVLQEVPRSRRPTKDWTITPMRMVVHYLQPHSPYIGMPPLKMTQWGHGNHPFSAECSALPNPAEAVREKKITWPEVREAYMGNLALVWEAARVLVENLPGERVVITSDHGEVLGEHGGLFGHECDWPYDELYHVPWLELRGGPRGEQETVEKKLEALGYV